MNIKYSMHQVGVAQQIFGTLAQFFISPNGKITTIGSYYGLISTIVFFGLFVFDLAPTSIRKLLKFLQFLVSSEEQHIETYRGYMLLWILVQFFGMLVIDFVAALIFPMLLGLIFALIAGYTIHSIFILIVRSVKRAEGQ